MTNAGGTGQTDGEAEDTQQPFVSWGFLWVTCHLPLLGAQNAARGAGRGGRGGVRGRNAH